MIAIIQTFVTWEENYGDTPKAVIAEERVAEGGDPARRRRRRRHTSNQ